VSSSTKIHVVFWPTKPLWNISPGKLALCSCLARMLAVAMFHVSCMFSHAWPSLQSWSAWSMAASQVQRHWCHSPSGVVCKAWVWEVQALRPLQRSTPTCSHGRSISWLTTWHRLATVCWMTCVVCLRCRPDVDCVWCHYLGSCIFRMSWMFARPPDIVARDTLLWFPDSHT